MLDKDIREKLYDYLDERYGKVRTIEEKVILKSRADMLAIIDGEIIGIEIKSDSDTYMRAGMSTPAQGSLMRSFQAGPLSPRM